MECTVIMILSFCLSVCLYVCMYVPLEGSSTACILTLDTSNGMLYSANIGDSGYLILRNGEMIQESTTLTHYFNCPYQLSHPPPGFNTSSVDRYNATNVADNFRDPVISGRLGLYQLQYKFSPLKSGHFL